jgi:predicted nucleotidyltransferase
MAYKYISSKDLELVAEGLKDLKNQMVFVGGAVVGLYVDVLSAKELRPTEDIDMTITLASFRNWYAIQEQLSDYGFHPDPFGHAICSFKYQDIPVDIMPAEDSPLGPANKWYALGFNNIWIRKIHDIEIQILPAPCFLATKFEAFKNRGKDYRTSHDFEDIIFIINNRESIVEEIHNAPYEIKVFLKEACQKILDYPTKDEILSVHISPLLIEEELPLLEAKIKQIAEI